MNAKNPAISVIIPMYNMEKYIRYCLDCILYQTFDDYEVILIDDASTDKTYEICRQICENNPAVILLKNEVNKGQQYSRNRGLDVAKGKYVYFMDSDDEILPKAMSVFYKKAEEEQADVVHTNMFIVSYAEGCMISRQSLLQGGISIEQSTGTMEGTVLQRFYEINRHLPMPWLNLIRKDFLIENGIRFRDIRISDDEAFVLELALKAKKFVKINEPLSIYRKFYNERERVEKRLPWILPMMGKIIDTFNEILDQFTPEEIPYNNRLDIIAGWTHYHLMVWIYDILDTRKATGYLRVKNVLQSAISKDYPVTGLIPVLVSLLDCDSDYRESMERERDEECERYIKSLLEIEEGKQKGDYAYIYSIAKRASLLEWRDNTNGLLVYRWLARAAFQLGRHREAWEVYAKALLYATGDAEESAMLRKERNIICPYLKEESVFDNAPFSNGEVMHGDTHSHAGEDLALGIYTHCYNITDGMLCCWREIMEIMPGARLVVIAEEFEVQAMMIEVMERLLDNGFDGTRICLEQPREAWLQSIDILLDTYPVSQGDLLAEALWQGIPAVTLCGNLQESQPGGSILVKVGLEELVARSGGEYVAKVVALAKDREFLRALKNHLPTMLRDKI